MSKTTLARALLFLAVLLATPAAAQLEQTQGRGNDDRPKARRQNRLRKVTQRDVSRLLKQFDQNKDGLLDSDEIPAKMHQQFASLDADEDGKFSESELLAMRVRSGRRAGEIITGPSRKERHPDSLQTGDPAPDFTLADPAGKRQVTLSDFRGKKPVVLIFGSYT